MLELAEQEDIPLLERVKFAAIYTSNLDEFFMIRVAGLHDQVDAGISDPGPDGRTPSQVIDELRERIVELNERQTRCSERELRPALAEHGIRDRPVDEVPEDEREALDERFRRQIFPVLTPLAVGLGRPFPYISNLSLSLAVLVRDPQTQVTTFARVKVPKEMLPRFVPVGRRARRSCRSRTSSPPTSTRCSRAWRSSTTASSGSRATPTSRSPTRPTTCCGRSRTSCAAGASARSCASRSTAA